jgi:hypothetical protein
MPFTGERRWTMSAIVILTPIVIASWPAISTAVAGAAAALGFVVKDAVAETLEQAKTEVAQQEQRSVEVELAESQVLTENLSRGQELVATKGTVELRIRRDERGRLSVCANGTGHSKAELRQIAEEFTQRVTQCYVYNRVMTELRSRGFQVITEETMSDQSLRIHVRRWEA